MKYTEDELKQRHRRTEIWKILMPQAQDTLRSLWKQYDDTCEKTGGMTKMVHSMVQPHTRINGCVYGEVGGRETDFKELVDMVEKHTTKRSEAQGNYRRSLNEYAVQFIHGNEEYTYETDGDSHHVQLKYTHHYSEEYDDFMGVTLETHSDGEYPSNLDSSLQHLRRIEQSENEYDIQEMIKLSKDIDERTNRVIVAGRGPDLRPLDSELLMHIANARRLANVVLHHFKE